MTFSVSTKTKTIRVEIGEVWHKILSITHRGLIQLEPTVIDEEMRPLAPNEMKMGLSRGGILSELFREVNPANVCLAAAEIATLFGFPCEMKNQTATLHDNAFTTGGLAGRGVMCEPGISRIKITQTHPSGSGGSRDTMVEVPKMWVNQWGRPSMPVRTAFSMLLRVEQFVAPVARTQGRNRPTITIFPDGRIVTR